MNQIGLSQFIQHGNDSWKISTCLCFAAHQGKFFNRSTSSTHFVAITKPTRCGLTNSFLGGFMIGHIVLCIKSDCKYTHLS